MKSYLISNFYLVLLFSLLLSACSKQDSTKNQIEEITEWNLLSIEVGSFDFGIVEFNQDKIITVQLYNDSEITVSGSPSLTSSDFSIVFSNCNNLLPQEKCRLKLYFNAKNKSGSIYTANLVWNEYLNVVSAQINRSNQLTQSSFLSNQVPVTNFSFGDIDYNHNLIKSIFITNTGTTKVNSSIVLSGSPAFVKIYDACSNRDLNIKASCLVKILVSGQGSLGLNSAQLSYNQQNLDFSVNVRSALEVAQENSEFVFIYNNQNISDSPLNLNTLNLNEAKEYRIFVKNIGSKSGEVKSLSLTPFFEVVYNNCQGKKIFPNESCFLKAFLKPETKGSFISTLEADVDYQINNQSVQWTVRSPGDTINCSGSINQAQEAYITWTGSDYTLCELISCSEGFHKSDNLCENNIQFCSDSTGSGTKTWQDTQYGVCEFSNCNNGYYLSGTTCLPQVCAPASVTSCLIDNATAQKTCNQQGSDYEPCSLVSCNGGFHPQGNSCEANIIGCSVDNGSGLQTWNGISYGSCVVNSCEESFHIENNACLSNIKSCSSSTISTGTQTWNGSEYDSCTPITCIPDYHIENNMCISDFMACNIDNGAGISTWNGSEYGSCIAQSCISDYHIENNQCLPDTKSCLVNEGSGTQTWNENNQEYDVCVVDTCNQYFAISSDHLSCELDASALNLEFSKLQRQSIISNSSLSTNAIITSGSQTVQPLFTINGLSNTKKYRLYSPTYLRYQISGTAGNTALQLNGANISLIRVSGQGAISAKIDHVFTPSSTSANISVTSLNSNGILTDNDGKIQLDIYEILNTVPHNLSQGSISSSQINENFNNTMIKETLIQSIPDGDRAMNTNIAVLTNLTVGQRYKLKASRFWYQNATCGTNPISALKLKNPGNPSDLVNLSLFQSPTDGYYGSNLDVEFTAWLPTLNLDIDRGSTNCTSFNVYFNDMGVYKMNTPSILHSFNSVEEITSQKLTDNFNQLYKKDILVNNYTKTGATIPTAGTTYVSSNIFTFSGLTVGKKYKLKTPSYINFFSGTSSAASFLDLRDSNNINTTIREFYSNTANANFYMQFEHEFTATTSTMYLQSRSRYSRGIQSDYNNQIAIDLYEAGN